MTRDKYVGITVSVVIVARGQTCIRACVVKEHTVNIDAAATRMGIAAIRLTKEEHPLCITIIFSAKSY